jgi:hypothetical protein
MRHKKWVTALIGACSAFTLAGCSATFSPRDIGTILVSIAGGTGGLVPPPTAPGGAPDPAPPPAAPAPAAPAPLPAAPAPSTAPPPPPLPPPSASTPPPAPAAPTSFAAIQPILQQNCTPCHAWVASETGFAPYKQGSGSMTQGKSMPPASDPRSGTMSDADRAAIVSYCNTP